MWELLCECVGWSNRFPDLLPVEGGAETLPERQLC